MPSKGETRHSHFATFFNTFRKDGECSKQSSQTPSKRQREENENPIIIVNQASTATLVEETFNEGNNFLSPPMFGERKKELALKLNRLKDKNARYESHEEFLLQCIRPGLIPRGLKLELEPTIGNQNQEFLDNWYSKLKDFSLILTKDIVKYCDDTIKETGALINSTEALLKQNMEIEEYRDIEEVILQNEETTKCTLKQQKFKKFNYLKYKPVNDKTLQPIETVFSKATLNFPTQML